MAAFSLIDRDRKELVSLHMQNFISRSAQNIYIYIDICMYVYVYKTYTHAYPPPAIRWKIGNLHACDT